MSSPGPSGPGGDATDATLFETLDELDSAVNYRRWIVDLARPVLAGPICEIGAGHGTMTAELAVIGAVVAVEPDPAAYERLERRFADHPDVVTIHGSAEAVSDNGPFRSAVLINVLEHIEDDGGALESLAEQIEPGGGLMIWVPAYQLLYSEFDRDLGHYRRYRKGELVDLVNRSGWDVERAHYVNLPGWFSWLLIARFFRQRPTGGPLVRIFDKVIVPAVRAVETRFRAPFGQSIVLLARKSDAPRGAATVRR